MTARARLVQSPPLVPQMPGWSPASEQIDGIIRMTWGMYLTGDISWTGAGRLHDRLVELRDGGSCGQS